MKTTTAATANPTVRTTTTTRTIVCVGMLAAISTILMLFEFPLPFIAPGFYELDFSEVPILIGAFALGPVAGVLTELVKILLNLVINGTNTAFVGEFANFVMGCAFVVPASVIYKEKEKSSARDDRTCSRYRNYVSGSRIYQCAGASSGLCKSIWNAC